LEPSTETYQNIYSKANKFVSNYNTYEDFNEAIQEKGLTKRMANNIQVNSQNIPGLEDPDKIIRAAFNTDEKQLISEQDNAVFEINDKFVIGFVTEVREEGTAPFDQVKEDIKLKVKENKKAEKIAKEMNSKLKESNTLAGLAGSMGLTPRQASNVNYSSVRIPGLGSEPKIAGVVATLEKDKLSYPIKGENGVYVVKITDISEQNITPEFYKQRTLQQMQRTAAYRAYEALKEAANIKDKRYKFY
jgi:peptidyl-prolyl cis-trans isomerase D